MSDWTVQDAIEAAKKDPESYGRQVYDLSNKRIELSNELRKLSNELRKLRGWFTIDDQKAKSSGDILLHLNTGHDSNGNVSWMTVIGRWEGSWNGSGLKNMGPRYWSPIPETPEHLRKALDK